jgi:hypothetical protein
MSCPGVDCDAAGTTSMMSRLSYKSLIICLRDFCHEADDAFTEKRLEQMVISLRLIVSSPEGDCPLRQQVVLLALRLRFHHHRPSDSSVMMQVRESSLLRRSCRAPRVQQVKVWRYSPRTESLPLSAQVIRRKVGIGFPAGG